MASHNSFPFIDGKKSLKVNLKVQKVKNLKVNDWKNTESVISWFKNIPDKHLYKFLMFDIKNYYSSIKAVMEGHKICQTLYFFL